MNATHLIKLGGDIYREHLLEFLSSFKIPKTVVQGGNIQVQGTYISFEHARQLCEHFYLSLDPIEELLAQETGRFEPAPAIEPVANVTPRTLDFAADCLCPPAAAPVSTTADGAGTTSYDGATYCATHDGSFGSRNREILSAPPLISRSVSNALLTDMEYGEAVADADHYSQYTESNYGHGSYLAPANRSYLELCTTDKSA